MRCFVPSDASKLVPHQECVFESQAKRVALGAIVRIVRQLAIIPLGNGLAIPALGEFGIIIWHQILPVAFRASQRLTFPTIRGRATELA